jgi:hypothetical protein
MPGATNQADQLIAGWLIAAGIRIVDERDFHFLLPRAEALD